MTPQESEEIAEISRRINQDLRIEKDEIDESDIVIDSDHSLELEEFHSYTPLELEIESFSEPDDEQQDTED